MSIAGEFGQVNPRGGNRKRKHPTPNRENTQEKILRK
jgi:hypothetical protein